MKFINDKVHGILDYVVAFVLIAVPNIFGFQAINPMAYWLSVAAGAGLIVYSLLTSYSISARKLIPFKVHLMLDFAAAMVFIAAPFIFGFEGNVSIYYIVSGVAIALVVLLTNPATKS
jgi:lipopolysaccharide export LptBFGC system permease protein LptF